MIRFHIQSEGIVNGVLELVALIRGWLDSWIH